MLETKPHTAGYAARPRPSSSRLSSGLSGASAARALPSREPLTDYDRRQAEREARRATGERSRTGRIPRSEARLLTWAVTSAVVVCGLLVLYLAAYAHLTMLGIAQSKAKHDLREKWQLNQVLRAQEATLRSPDHIAARAVRLGLTKNSVRVDYIRPISQGTGVSTPPPPVVLDDAAQASVFSVNTVTKAGPKGTNSGPKTEDNLTARND